MANETVLFKRGDSATITSTPITDGQILFDTSGNGKMYLDNGTTRLAMGGSVTIDSTLSKTSTNAVQNKAVTGNILNSLAEVSAATQQNTIAGALALKEVNSSLESQPDFVYDSTGKITGYKTKVGADTVFPFSSGSNYIKIEVEHNPNTGLTISEQIGKSSSLIKVATIPNINTSYKTGLCTYKRGTNSTTDTITFNVSGSYKITLNNVETVYSINAGESKTFTISRTKMTIEVTIV